MTIDSLIPKDIKPLLYQYDQYQTYDLIVWDASRVMRSLSSPIKYLNNFSFFQEKLLVDRFSPWNYPWCEHYSTKLFYFIYEFTGTDRCPFQSYREEVLSFDFPSFELRDMPLVSFNVPATPKSELIVFSWLIKEEIQGVVEYSKTYRTITTSEIGYIFEINFTNFVYCSLVISSSNSAISFNLENQLSNGYLYNKFDELLNLLSETIKRVFPKLFYVIKSYSYIVKAKIDFGSAPNRLLLSQFVGNYNSITDFFKEMTVESFAEVPAYYKFASLLYANNNKWNQSVSPINKDLGKNLIYFKINNTCQYFFVIPYQKSYQIPDVFFSIKAPGEITDYVPGYVNAFRPFENTRSEYPLKSGDILLSTPWDPGFYFTGIYPDRPGLPGLIDYISGQKFFLFGFGGIHYENSSGVKSDYYVVKAIAEISTDGASSITGDYFSHVGSVFQSNSSNTFSNSFNYSDELFYTGEIVIHYFDSDEDFTLKNILVSGYLAEPITNAEAVELIDKQRRDVEMPDSIRIKEIHAALQAEKFAYAENSTDARVANLGYYVERIARVLGISVNSDGSIRSIRQKKVVERGGTIPGGWYFGQFGSNRGGGTDGQQGGNASDERDGIVYEQRSNKFVPSLFNLNELEIHQGDYTLCENIPQLLDEILDDLDKALGWQDLGASAIPNADGSNKTLVYNGLAQLLTELAFTSSRMSQHTSQGLIASLVAQGIAFEILKATGQELIPKALEVDTGDTGYAQVPYPGIANDAPSQLEQTKWILQSLAPMLGSLLKVDELDT